MDRLTLLGDLPATFEEHAFVFTMNILCGEVCVKLIKAFEKLWYLFKTKLQGISRSNRATSTTLSSGKSVSFGARVTIEDTITKDTFKVDIEENLHNRRFMSEVQKALMGKTEGAIVSFKANKYKILEVDKSPEKEGHKRKPMRIDELS